MNALFYELRDLNILLNSCNFKWNHKETVSWQILVEGLLIKKSLKE